jgi:hypothetical protein
MVSKCERIVEESLTELLQPGVTADELYLSYMMFGEDPWIAGQPEDASPFSGWDHARRRTRELCSPTGMDTASRPETLDEING